MTRAPSERPRFLRRRGDRTDKKVTAGETGAGAGFVRIRGPREHNLKEVALDILRNARRRRGRKVVAGVRTL